MSKREIPNHIRDGAVEVSVYNEALCAYLYDQANEEQIVKLIQSDSSKFRESDPNDHKPFRPLWQNGWLIMYSLEQDDPISAQIVVGPPATKEEKKRVPMRRTIKSFLSLPSGKLLIHSPNTAPWNRSTEDKPAIVEVPPGDYTVTIHHIDYDKIDEWMEELDVDEDTEYEVPAQFITLTPISELEPPRSRKVAYAYPE